MEKLYVYADIDWLESPMLVGELTFDSIRGNQTYGFSFDNEWLAKYGHILISVALSPYPGIQYTSQTRDIFGCFGDICPQRWGRTLFTLRELIIAKAERRPNRKLTSFDCLETIDDFSRMGGLRFSMNKREEFINADNHLRVQRLANIQDLIHAVIEIEESKQKHLLASEKCLDQILIPATPLGGARPKASVIDEEGVLCFAKFPSITDDYDVEGWEHWCHIMARKAGITVADTRILLVKKSHILFSKQFDRTFQGKRIHFASALTMFGLTDGDNASTGHDYLEIVDFIIRHGATPESDLKELFRRVAYHIIVGNTDDHFRNHGFLLTPNGWILSPSYDLNPTLLNNQSLLINNTTNESDLDILIESASEYILTQEEASSIIQEVKGALRSWIKEAKLLNLPKCETDLFAPRIDKWL